MSSNKYDLNAPETEEDGLIAGKLRLKKIREDFKKLAGREHSFLPLTEDLSQQKDFNPDDKSNTPR